MWTPFPRRPHQGDRETAPSGSLPQGIQSHALADPGALPPAGVQDRRLDRRGDCRALPLYFVRPGGTAKMVIEDDGEALQLDEIYEQMMHASAVPQELTIKGEELHLLHVKLRAKANAAHVVA